VVRIYGVEHNQMDGVLRMK
jgi:hypothetical protein